MFDTSESANTSEANSKNRQRKAMTASNLFIQIGGCETAISNAKHQLELLGIAIEERRAAISTLVDLRKSGMTEDNIMNLTRVVNGWGNGSMLAERLA
jgi:hypothetical protein